MENEMQSFLYGIDPGSSKSWVSCRVACRGLPVSSDDVVFEDTPIATLESFISRLITEAKAGNVLLAVDAPICMPLSFNFPGASLKGSYWPLNLNPFSVRSCEKSLNSTPSVMNSSLQVPELAQLVAKLCGWGGEYRDSSNQSFTTIHPGLSVLGYQGAPHGPVVRLFRDRLERQAVSSGVTVSYSPAEASDPQPQHIYVLESHPAVTMAVWISQRQLGETLSLAKYKGDSSAETKQGFRSVRAGVVDLFRRQFVSIECEVSTDDELDALVGLANCIDLQRGNCDWWGTEDAGYFLIPKVSEGAGESSVRQAWDEASNRLKTMESIVNE